jgi:hypothetical protein
MSSEKSSKNWEVRELYSEMSCWRAIWYRSL